METVTFLEDASLTADESNLFIANLDYTLDFGGKTITLTEEFNFGRDKTGNVVLTNGTIQLAADYAMMVRLYGASVTIADVTIDATHLIVNTTKSPDAYAGAIIATTGDVILKGNTQVINVSAGLNGLAFNNYGSKTAYALGTLDLTEFKGTISGNTLITGGAVKGAKAEMFEGDVNVGASGNSYATSLGEDSGFAALAGAFATDYAASAYRVNITGKAYFTVADAFANATDTVTLADDATANVEITDAKAFTLDLNGKTLTTTDGEWAAVKVDNAGAVLTIAANDGKIVGGATFCVWARQGTVNISDGTYENDSNDNYAIYAGGGKGTAESPWLVGTVNISGGTFVNKNTDPYIYNPLLSRLNLNVKNGSGSTITVTGGSYTADPAGGDDSTVPASFLASHYWSKLNAETSLYDVKAMLKYYATVYAEGVPYTWAGLGTGDAYYAEGVTVDALTAGVTNIGGQVYYVSKLLRKGDPADLVCEFEYDGTTLTKKEGATLDVTVNADNSLSYKVTTGEPYTLDSLGHACIGGVYYTKYDPPSNPVEPGNDGTSVTNNVDGSVTIEENKTNPGQASITLNDTTTTIKVTSTIDTLTVAGETPAEGQIVVLSRDGVTDITAACKMTTTGNVIDLSLNPDAVVEGVPVKPTATADDTTPISDGAVATKTIPGLTYQLIRGDEPGQVTTALTTDGAVKTAKTASTTLTDANKPEGKAFYKVQVTK